MSLRKQAQILGVNAGHLSRMVSGKRPWNAEVKARYEALVGNTSGNTSPESLQNRKSEASQYSLVQSRKHGVVGGIRVELMTSAMSTQRSKPLS